MVADRVKPKVLFIDDDPLVHRLYQPHVEQAAYQMLSLFNASEVLQAVSR